MILQTLDISIHHQYTGFSQCREYQDTNSSSDGPRGHDQRRSHPRLCVTLCCTSRTTTRCGNITPATTGLRTGSSSICRELNQTSM
jgi:hypothetical protein